MSQPFHKTSNHSSESTRPLRSDLFSFALLWTGSLMSLAVACQPAYCDLVKLNNGGEIRGKFVSYTATKEQIQLETMTGAVVVVERSEIQFATTRPAVVEEYESASRRINDDTQSHWELAEWCRQKGLIKQRETHLRRVVELSPEHEKAQTLLGRVWHQGDWVDKDELMASQGYVKYKNRYITPQELEVIENTADELAREKSWFQKVKLWHGWLDGHHENKRPLGLSNLASIDDPNAAPAVMKFLSTDSRIEIREMAIVILAKVSGSKAAAGLVKLTLYDEALQIRTAALDGIQPEIRDTAQIAFIKALKHDSNAVVCRAANALGEIGDRDCITPLIESLMTVHQYQVAVDVPSNQTYSFSTDGNSSSGAPALPPGVLEAVKSGQLLPPVIVNSPDAPAPLKRLVNVRVEHTNAEALAALSKLTQQNFGYDKRTWSLWWAAEKNANAKLKGKS